MISSSCQMGRHGLCGIQTDPNCGCDCHNAHTKPPGTDRDLISDLRRQLSTQQEFVSELTAKLAERDHEIRVHCKAYDIAVAKLVEQNRELGRLRVIENAARAVLHLSGISTTKTYETLKSALGAGK